MPITEITYQNPTESIQAAYNPIIFRCKATVQNPTPEYYKPEAVFCDIYVEGIYYKSLWKTYPILDIGMEPEYEFDIQDAMQELLLFNLPELGRKDVQTFKNTIKTVFVRFRNSHIVDGYTESEQAEPVQGTNTSAPVEGGGIQSNSFYVINAGIQPTEPQDMTTLLNLFKTGSWQLNVFPLTKRPKLFRLCRTDSSYFPIISNVKPGIICVKIYNDDGGFIEHCVDIKECPVIEDLSYTIEQVGVNQKFIFDWQLPDGYEVAINLTVFYKTHGYAGWLTQVVDINPTTEITLPLGKYDFKFKLNGDCQEIDFDELPGFINIGIISGAIPDANIWWEDNHTTEPKNCLTGESCSHIIEVQNMFLNGLDLDYAVWQKSTDDGTTWVDIIDYTENTQSVQSTTTGEHRYRLKMVDEIGSIGYSNALKVIVGRVTGHALISGVTTLPNSCTDAGRVIQFTVEGESNQIVKVHLEVLDAYGHGAIFVVYDENNIQIFGKSINNTGQIFIDHLPLGTTGVKTYRGEMCLRPCLSNQGGAGTALMMTLYENDNETLSNQYITWSATMNCDL